MPEPIEISPEAAETIVQFVRRMVKVAKEKRLPVKGVFNKVSLRANPLTHPELLRGYYLGYMAAKSLPVS